MELGKEHAEMFSLSDNSLQHQSLVNKIILLGQDTSQTAVTALKRTDWLVLGSLELGNVSSSEAFLAYLNLNLTLE
jgi:hypothetical protein